MGTDRAIAWGVVAALAAAGCPRAGGGGGGAGAGAAPDAADAAAKARALEDAHTRIAELERKLEAGEGKPAPWKIVNFHDHVYKMEHAERYVAAARATGVVKTVLVASPKYTIFGKGGSKTDGFDENFQEILQIAARWPDQFVPFTSLDPGDPGKLDMLKRHRALGAKGLKLYSGHSHFFVKEQGLMPPGMDEVLAYLVAEKMPVLWHIRVADHVAEMEERILKRHPDLKVVIAHYGVAFWRPESGELAELARLLEAYPNLYFDTSLGTRKILVDGLAVMGRHREKFRDLMTKYPGRFVMGTDMVITGNPEKSVSWMAQVIWACRDQLEQDEFTLSLAAPWSSYRPKRGAGPDGRMRGLSLPEDVLRQIYETTPAKILGG